MDELSVTTILEYDHVHTERFSKEDIFLFLEVEIVSASALRFLLIKD